MWEWFNVFRYIQYYHAEDKDKLLFKKNEAWISIIELSCNKRIRITHKDHHPAFKCYDPQLKFGIVWGYISKSFNLLPRRWLRSRHLFPMDDGSSPAAGEGRGFCCHPGCSWGLWCKLSKPSEVRPSALSWKISDSLAAPKGAIFSLSTCKPFPESGIWEQTPSSVTTNSYLIWALPALRQAE